MFIIDKNNPTPLYFQLQNSIVDLINEGTFEENTSLPSELEIIESTGLSRTTVRQAIENLVQEGYLERRRGIGTFVKTRNKNLWDLENLRSFREVMEMEGKQSSTSLISVKKIPTNRILEKRFGEDIKEFYELERLRYLDGTPIILVNTFIPVSLVPGLDTLDLENNSLFEIMKKEYKVKIAFAEKELRARVIRPYDANLLELPLDSVVQLVDTITYNDEGKPIEYSVSRDRGDVSVYKVRLTYQD